MQFFRALLGIVLILAGVAGLAASVVGIVAVQSAVEPLSQEALGVLDSTEEAIHFLKQGAEKLQDLFAETKGRTDSLDAALGEIAEKVKNSPSGKTLLDNLDENLATQLRRAQNTAAALQSTLREFQNVLVLFDSLSAFSSAPAQGKKKNQTQELSRSLMDASETIEQIARFLSELLSDRQVTERRLSDVRSLVERIQTRLEHAENRLAAFQQRLRFTEDRVLTSKASLPAWIDQGGMVAVIFLACFACTQIGLLLQAFALFRRPRREAS